MAEDSKKSKREELNIELDEEVGQGIYANLAVITHSSSEFIMDFIRLMPNVPKSKVKSRIILTPEHAKRMMKALQDNISKYEQQHGPIKNTGESGSSIPMNFGGPTAKA